MVRAVCYLCAYMLSPEDGIGPTFVTLVSHSRNCASSDANSTGEDALHQPYHDGLLDRCRCAKQCTGKRASEERDGDDESCSVLRSHSRLTD